MKLIFKNANETPKKEIKPEPREISSALPTGKFMEHSSNPYRFWGDSSKKTYIDKYCNTKQTIKDNKSLKVKYF